MTMTLRKLHLAQHRRSALYVGILLAFLALLVLRLGQALPINAWSRMAIDSAPSNLQAQEGLRRLQGSND